MPNYAHEADLRSGVNQGLSTLISVTFKSSMLINTNSKIIIKEYLGSFNIKNTANFSQNNKRQTMKEVLFREVFQVTFDQSWERT